MSCGGGGSARRIGRKLEGRATVMIQLVGLHIRDTSTAGVRMKALTTSLSRSDTSICSSSCTRRAGGEGGEARASGGVGEVGEGFRPSGYDARSEMVTDIATENFGGNVAGVARWADLRL